MLKQEDKTGEIHSLIDKLWKDYPSGFVANVGKGDVPERCRELAKYLAKYVASPPIAIRRIVKYDGQNVTYWYKDHETKSRKRETVDVYTLALWFFPWSILIFNINWLYLGLPT